MPERYHITIPDGDGGMALRVTRTFPGLPVGFTLVAAGKGRGTHWSRFCSRYVAATPSDDKAMLELLTTLDRPDGPNVLLPIMTPAFQFVVAHQDALAQHFSIPPIAAAESLATASDKAKLYDFCLARGFPVLPSVPLAATGGTDGGGAGLAFPVLVKTRDRQGGEGFLRVETPRDLANLRDSLDPREASRRFVQPWVDGYDVSLAAYCEGGEIKCHTLWRALSYGAMPYFTPECIQFIEDDRIFLMGCKVLRALAWEGICDIDFFVDRRTGELWLLEVNARFFGTAPACAIAGVNFTRIMCERALSREEREWPVQRPEVFCETRGLRTAIQLPGVRAKLLRRPLKRLSLGIFLRDPGPDLYRWLATLRASLAISVRRRRRRPDDGGAPRRDRSWLHLVAVAFLGAQLVSTLYAPFVPVRFFCWAPYDEHTRYSIDVTIAGRALAPDEIARRYRYPQSTWEIRDIDNVISIVRQYEESYGAGEEARVALTYRTNGREQRTWTWPR
jgi:predicted ATP-grasp superfamily ATP-dependent carboligase